MSRGRPIRCCILLGVIAVVAGLGGGLVIWLRGEATWTRAKIAASMSAGDEIVAAIERYREDHEHAIPPSLEALVPAYLPEIPPCSAGERRWTYFINADQDYYVVSFYKSDAVVPYFAYDSVERTWMEDDGSF